MRGDVRAGERRVVRSLLLFGLALWLAGCATVDPFAQAPIVAHLQRTDGVGDCARLLRELDRQVVAADARDAQDTVVPGFPYLRVDRLSAALAPDVADELRWRQWRGRLAALDRQARRHELRNAVTSGGPIYGAMSVDACRTVLLDADDAREARAQLRAVAQVPDDYSITLRALGLYPLTKLAFAAGIRGWHREARAEFAAPLDRLPRLGELRRYAPEEDAARAIAAAPDRWRAAPSEPMAPMTRDALGVPQVEALAALLQRHAPIVEVDDSGAYDRIGPLAIGAGSPHARVDLTEPPVAYARLAFGRLGGVLRAQLVYTFWFPARPKDGAFDLLGGELDALVWRVTLDDRGNALAFDSIHACGCYHMFFATPRVRARNAPPPGQGRFDEGLFLPQDTLPDIGPAQRVALRVASRSHYLQRVSVVDAPAGEAIAYRLRDEDELRSLTVARADAGGRASRSARSVYGADGMIPGTERLERFFFWPMGIASAGQMRQWGRHATAFVGRRHFDDPALLDRYFALADCTPDAANATAGCGPLRAQD